MLDRRSLLTGAVATAAAAPGASRAAASADAGPTAMRAAATGDKLGPLYDRSIVIDCLSSPTSTNVPIPPPGPLTPAQLANARQSGITALNLTVNKNDFAPTVRQIAFWQNEIEAHPEHLLQVRTHADIVRAKRELKLGLILGFQGADCIGDDLALLELFRGLGVRIIQLTYNIRNRLGDGSLVSENHGLTPFGHEVVGRLNDLRIVVDLSHSGRQTTYEGLMASKRPPIISHTGCRAVYDHPRNQDDRQLKACADQGGVVGIYLMPFLGGDPDRPSRALLLRHIEHALNVCGNDHVGIGSDLSINPIEETPEYLKFVLETNAKRKAAGISAPREDMPVYTPDLNKPRRLEMIADGLSARGIPTFVIEKVIGGNFSRVFREVWGDVPIAPPPA
jgi:membrane dipeptidase